MPMERAADWAKGRSPWRPIFPSKGLFYFFKPKKWECQKIVATTTLIIPWPLVPPTEVKIRSACSLFVSQNINLPFYFPWAWSISCVGRGSRIPILLLIALQYTPSLRYMPCIAEKEVVRLVYEVRTYKGAVQQYKGTKSPELSVFLKTLEVPWKYT